MCDFVIVGIFVFKLQNLLKTLHVPVKKKLITSSW